MEIELVVFSGGIRIGLEYKRTNAPIMTRSMHVVLAELRIERIHVLVPGHARFRLHECVEAVGLGRACAEELE